VWGEVRQAILTGAQLPPDVFLDVAGHPTTDPSLANAVLAFGGHKGTALCIALELLVGVLAGTPVGTQIADEYETGAVVVAIRTDVDSSSNPVDSLRSDFARCRRTDGREGVYFPGATAGVRWNLADPKTEIAIERSVLNELERFAAGDRLDLDAADDRLN
jgi:LDH2 family malate/lactate/ureidoglycolate dehydrogenase